MDLQLVYHCLACKRICDTMRGRCICDDCLRHMNDLSMPSYDPAAHQLDDD